jgi:hypothetical protein
MENKKDIGKAISDKLNSLDKTPREQVWSGISYELQKKKKRRIAFFFFWGKTVGLLLIGAIAALYIYDKSTGHNFLSPGNSKETITVNDKNASNNDRINGNDSTIENSAVKNNATSTNNAMSTEENNTADENEFKNKNNIGNKYNNGSSNKDDVESENLVNQKNNGSSAKSPHKRNSNTISSKFGTGKSGYVLNVNGEKSIGKSKAKLVKNYKTKSKGKSKSKSEKGKEDSSLTQLETDITKSPIVDLSSLENKNVADKTEELKTKKTDSLIAKKKKEKEININMYPKDSVKTDSTKIYRKIDVDAFVSPTLYGFFNDKSVLDRDLDSLPKKSEMKFSYGFGITYDLTKRISIRIGYRKINISYVTQNAPIGVNVSASNNFSGISYNPNVSNESIYMASGSETMDITQKISYTEIPLEIKYNFLDKKFGLKSSFGFSYLALSENKISIKTPNGYAQDIGKTKNLATTSVSVNLGLEMDYPILKNTKIFMQPMFNYQVKAFSDGNFKPYVFGIHTGIRYSFNE